MTATDFEKPKASAADAAALQEMIDALEKLTGFRLIRSDLLVSVTVIVAGQKYSGLFTDSFERGENHEK